MTPEVRQGILQAHALRRRGTARLASAWKGCLKLEQEEFPLLRIEKAIRLNETWRIEATINGLAERMAGRFSEFVRDEYHRAMILEAVKAGPIIEFINKTAITKAVDINYGKFGITNPASNLAHSQNKLNLIRETAQQQRKTLNSILSSGSIEGLNPKESARYIRDHIGLTEHQERVIGNYRKELSGGKAPSMKAFNRKLRDKRYDKMTRKFFEGQQPLPPEKVDKMVDRYREKFINHRAETIAKTEALRSSRRGAHDMWENLIDEGTIPPDRMLKFWVHVGDSGVRTSHHKAPQINRAGRKIKEPFITGNGNKLMYPGEAGAPAKDTINCRCQAVYRPKEPDKKSTGLQETPDSGGFGAPTLPAGRPVGASAARPAGMRTSLPRIDGFGGTRPPASILPRVEGFGRGGPPLDTVRIAPPDIPPPMKGVPFKARKALGEVLNRRSPKRPKINPTPVVEPVPINSPEMERLYNGASEVAFYISDVLNSPIASMMGRKKFDNKYFEYLMDRDDVSAMLGESAGLLPPGFYDENGEFLGETYGQ